MPGNKRESIIKIFDTVEKKVKDMIENEKEKVNETVKKNKQEIKSNFMNFQQQVEFKIKEMENQVNKEFDNLGVEIKEFYDNTLKSLNTGLFKYEKALNAINTDINKALIKAYILTGIKYVEVASFAYLTLFGVSTMITGGPIGIVIGIGILAFSIGFGILNYKGYGSLAKEYFDYYNNYKKNFEQNIFYSKEKVLKDFDNRREIILKLKQLNMSLQGIKLRLHASNDAIYERKCQ